MSNWEMTAKYVPQVRSVGEGLGIGDPAVNPLVDLRGTTPRLILRQL